MKFTANQITNIYETLDKLAKENLTLGTAIAIADNIESMSTAYKIVSDKRMACIQEYAKKDENGDYVRDENNPESVLINNPEEFNIKMIEMMNTEIDVDVKEFSLDGETGITMTPIDILYLRPLLKKDKKEEPVVEKVDDQDVEVID